MVVMRDYSQVNRFSTEQTSHLTLEEVSQARPPRATGAPARTRSHYERILALLKERGPAGVTSIELYNAPHLYGRSPRNRISELRRDGHLIKTEPAGASVVCYVLTHENPAPSTPRPHIKGASDYMRRVREEQDALMPLFSEVGK